MQHCQKLTYSDDFFCGHCGETVEQTSRFIIEDVNPNILEDIKCHYPSAYAITGKVVTTYYYKRVNKTSNSSLTHAYWWIELVDKEGTVHHTSISAESDYTAEIKKGDVLTLFQPSDYTLMYSIKNKEVRKIVSHDNSAPCVFIHLKSEQRQSIVPLFSNEPVKQSTTLWFMAFIALFIGSIWLLELPFVEAGILSSIISIMLGVWEFKHNKEKYQEELLKHDALLNAYKNILKISQNDLGYTSNYRGKDNSDVICIHCSKRIPPEHKYCVHCGNQPNVSLVKNNNEKKNKIDNVLTSSINSSTENLNLELTNTAPLTVKAIQDEIEQEYSLKYSSDYIHKRALASDSEATVDCEFILMQIIDTKVKSNVSDVTTITETTQETKHYRGGYYNHSTYSKTSSSFRNRNASISGKVIGRLVNGKDYTFTFAEHIIASIEKGDWIIIADSDIKFNNDEDLYFIEYAYNITKDKNIKLRRSFMSYTDSRSISRWKMIGILSIVIGVLMALASVDDNLLELLMVSFGGITLWGIIFGMINSAGNHNRRKKVFEPLIEKIELLKPKLAELKIKLHTLD